MDSVTENIIKDAESNHEKVFEGEVSGNFCNNENCDDCKGEIETQVENWYKNN